jgi:hypothetical protein
MLAEQLPAYDVNEVHAVTIAAPPEVVMRSVREVTAGEVPLLVVLMGLRTLPALLRGQRPSIRRPILDGFAGRGFVALAEDPDELVFGVVGRFWQPSGGVRRISPDEFRGFAEPGYAKGAIGFRVERRGDRTVLTTETRVAVTDEAARTRFRRYWRLVHPGSAAIRIAWLRAIRRRAEAQPGSSPRSARA